MIGGTEVKIGHLAYLGHPVLLIVGDSDDIKLSKEFYEQTLKLDP